MLSMVDFGYDNCAARLNMLAGWLCFLNWLASYAGYAGYAGYSVWLGELGKLTWLFGFAGKVGWLLIMALLAG
jgi:hypothetical protein